MTTPFIRDTAETASLEVLEGIAREVWPQYIELGRTAFDEDGLLSGLCPFDPGTCSSSAVWLAKNHFQRFGADIYGYWHDDNPTAEAGEVEGGHDFLVLPGGYIIDFWLKEVRILDLPLVLDPKRDCELIARFYGNPKCWSRTPLLDD